MGANCSSCLSHLCVAESAHTQDQSSENTALIPRDTVRIAAIRGTYYQMVPSIARSAPDLHTMGKCDTLRMHSQAISDIISRADIEAEVLDRINNHFIMIMDEASFSIRYWVNLDCYETLAHQFDIGIAIKEKLRRLDACFVEFRSSINEPHLPNFPPGNHSRSRTLVTSSMGPQWTNNFASAQERDIGALRRELERQKDPERWRNAYKKLLDNVLKKLQILLNQQISTPEQDNSYRTILMILGIETPYVVRAGGHQTDLPRSTPEPSTIESSDTSDEATVSVEDNAMQQIVTELKSIGYHMKKIDILRSHCGSIFNEIKGYQDSDQVSAALRRFTGFWIVFRPFVRFWASLDSSESYIHQFTITADIEAILERLDTILVVNQLPPRSWETSFGNAVTKDSDSLAGILRQQGAEIWNTIHREVLDSVVEYLPALIKYHDPSSSTEETTTKILDILGISLQKTETEVGTSGVRGEGDATVTFAQSLRKPYEMALASVNAFAKTVDAFPEIHPYVKAAWTVLSAGSEIAVAQQNRDDALFELLESMSTALDLICRFDNTARHSDDKDVILRVAKKTNECALFIREYTRTESFALRAAKGILSNVGDEVARFKRDFDILHRNLGTGSILSITEGISGVNEALYGVEESVKLIRENVDRAANLTAIIDKLPYAEGAVWDPERGCLPDTRTRLLTDILQWIKRPDDSNGAQIFCLTGVAGSGKSAIAHSVAHRCYEEGLLASSFFFSRDVAERSNPRMLLSTMARDLARDPRIREQISLAIESDQSLTTAPLSRQFGPLIREPCLRYPSGTPMVAVIDGLNEGYSVDLLELLRDGIPSLPQSFRFFITSREMESIDQYLSKSAHVHLETIDLGAEAYQDIRAYIRHGLKDIARMHHLGESWPSQEAMERLIDMSGGLPQWASVVLRVLKLSYNPAAKLSQLLAELRTGHAAEEKMDEIYFSVLRAYDWDNLDFKPDYDLVMGTILALKTPISVSALQTLHPGINITNLLSRLGVLLTGWRNANQPVRILHLSLRDFLTARAPSSAPFYINEKDHSRRLGLVCLAALNEGLKEDSPGIGYLDSDSPGVPAVSKSQVPEELWYACEFWVAHVVEFDVPVPADLIELLRKFLSVRLIPWLEICASMDTFRGFRQIRVWIERTFPEDMDLLNDSLNSSLSNALVNISKRLGYMDRREEALLAIQEAVELHRQLAQDHPAAFNSNLADSLSDLSNRLSDLGQREDALAAIREAVDLCRQLASDRPAAFSPNLAHSLYTLSNQLSDLGHREDALAAVREATELHRQLAKDRPAVFNPNLAASLDSLANRLSDLGRREDALAAIREGVELHRSLASDRPATFNADLATSLNSLSQCLSALGHREDALAAAREAVDIYRPLMAKEIPAVFTPLFTDFLRRFSTLLRDMGYEDDARAAEQEADTLNSSEF
ncbi:hypothetical protein BOTBODRAFT_38228 [Botryobasidium botryosum FD-172 SS1]|uniref:TPR-like protein n=1 Tax=Botryobasidium botryosum (strain FD-172 SS1) TaxID=930990 RepID=A0A067M953_BOTB1|nr:hypothetical protein BOTBODRAFT_38228 [Botryobasidium botryosum FD-172 SS1]